MLYLSALISPLLFMASAILWKEPSGNPLRLSASPAARGEVSWLLGTSGSTELRPVSSACRFGEASWAGRENEGGVFIRRSICDSVSSTACEHFALLLFDPRSASRIGVWSFAPTSDSSTAVEPIVSPSPTSVSPSPCRLCMDCSLGSRPICSYPGRTYGDANGLKATGGGDFCRVAGLDDALELDCCLNSSRKRLGFRSIFGVALAGPLRRAMSMSLALIGASFGVADDI